MKITFLGAGAFGSALAKIAEYNGHETKFYDPIKYPGITLEEATNGTDVNVFVAPSNTFSEIATKLDKALPLICASKGFLSLSPFAEFEKFSVLSGAGFASSILDALTEPEPKEGKTVTLTASSALCEELFTAESIKIEYTDDHIGILLCGALKNVYAIGAGFYSAGEQQSTMSYLENVISEFRDILTANGGKPDTLKLSCGVSDLVLSSSEGSRNFRFGAAIKIFGENNPEKIKEILKKETVEGVSIIKSIPDLQNFNLPSSADLFRDIIKIVNHYL